MRTYLFILPFVFLVFIYNFNAQTYYDQNYKLNNATVNSFYNALEIGNARSYQQDTTDETILVYSLIYFLSQELPYNFAFDLEIKLVSTKPYVIHVALRQPMENDFETNISRYFIMDSKN